MTDTDDLSYQPVGPGETAARMREFKTYFIFLLIWGRIQLCILLRSAAFSFINDHNPRC